MSCNSETQHLTISPEDAPFTSSEQAIKIDVTDRP